MNLDIQALKFVVGAVDTGQAIGLLNATGVTAEDLEDTSLRPLWALVEDRIRRRVPLEFTSIHAALRERVAKEIILDVLSDGYMHAGAAQCLETVKERSQRRGLQAGLQAILASNLAGASLSTISSNLGALAAATIGSGSRVRSAVGDTARIIAQAEERFSKKGHPWVRTGWPDLDRELVFINNLHIIGAGTGAGKSALVAGLVRNWLGVGVKVGVLAYEDDGLDMQRRIFACRAKTSILKMLGECEPTVAEHMRWESASDVGVETEQMLWLDDESRGSAVDVVTSIRRMHSLGCRVVVLDNMTCLKMGANDRRLEVEEALLKFRAAAIELKIPVIIVGHLNRRSTAEADDVYKTPRLSDFAEAAAWERMARSAIGIWREQQPDGTDQVLMKILKQTNGAAGAEFTVDFAKEAATVIGVHRREQAAKYSPPKGKFSR